MLSPYALAPIHRVQLSFLSSIQCNQSLQSTNQRGNTHKLHRHLRKRLGKDASYLKNYQNLLWGIFCIVCMFLMLLHLHTCQLDTICTHRKKFVLSKLGIFLLGIICIQFFQRSRDTCQVRKLCIQTDELGWRTILKDIVCMHHF